MKKKLLCWAVAVFVGLWSVCSAVTIPGMSILQPGFHNTTEVYDNPGLTTHVNVTFDYIVDNAAASGSPQPIKAGTELTAFDANHNTVPASNVPLPTVAMAIQEAGGNLYDISIYVTNPSNDAASDVVVVVDLFEGLFMDENTASLTGTLTTVLPRRQYNWTIGALAANSAQTEMLNFTANVNIEYLHGGTNFYYASLSYKDGVSNDFGPMPAETCINGVIVPDKNIFYQHGFTALTFFMALILGVLLVCLGFFIYFMMRRRKSISPSKANSERLVMERGKTIMMDEHEAVKRTGHTINDYSVIGEGDSIVGVLAMKDKMQMHREIDSLDIVNTVNVDTDLEKERNDSSMATTELLITGLHSNNDINKQTLDHSLGNMRQRRVHMDKQQDEDYKREMKKLYKKISAKNRAMMNTLLNKQRTEKKELVSNTQNLPTSERNELIKLMNEQHLSEQNAETYKLKLEQDEETEKLRKEFAIRTRMGMKEIQLQALSDVKDQGKLSDQQMKWLLEEHQKTQKNLEGLYDEEISRQRMILEEKLARRKALAQTAETQEENTDDLLNTVAGQQVITIEKMKKSKAVSAADANVLIDQAKAEMIALKEKMEKDRAAQENDLHKRLSTLKKKRQSDLAKEQEAELKEYERRCKEMQTDGPVDPSTYVDGRLKLLSQQREERSTLENEIDDENQKELSTLRNSIAMQTEAELRAVSNSLKDKIADDSDAQSKLDRLMEEHRNETLMLRNAQEKNLSKMKRKLQDRLEENKELWNQRREAERGEQEQLREYEDSVVNKLVNSQVSMSDDERQRIMKEHEKQMVQLENSLTLNKLRQKRMIEDKIAQRRAAQMEKLKLKQESEKVAQNRKQRNNADDSEDESVQQDKANLMKEHVEQKMAVLQGRKMDWDTELESIRVEMLKERSLALKEQEEKLGALVAELQLAKAKELAKIEEQQKAIHNLKTNLIDDLNARGVLSDPETQAVIKRHQEEQDQLNQRLDEQRSRQEEMLRQKLQLRLQQREKSMITKQDEEIKALAGPNKTANKIRKMMLVHNHMVAMEKMRNQLEREISQTLEQVRYEYEVCKRKAIQDQEMEFIAGLVRVGTIPKEDLESVLAMLYPGKTDEEMKQLLNKIFDPKLQSKQPLDHAQASQLLSRVKKSQETAPPFLRRGSQLSLSSNASRPSKRSLRKSQRDAAMYSSPMDQQQYYDHDQYEDNARFRPSSRTFEDTQTFPHPARRLSDSTRSNQFRPSDRSYDDAPHPLEENYGMRGSLRQNGQAYGNRIMEDDEDSDQATYVPPDHRQQIPSKLPPLQPSTGKKKKKKKFLKKMAEHSPRAYPDD